MQDNKRIWSLGVALLALTVVAMFRGCGGYGEVGAETYKFATALYSICNRQAVADLGKFETMLSEARAKGEVSRKEHNWLVEIVAIARDGDWKTATQKSRRLLEDQVTGN